MQVTFPNYYRTTKVWRIECENNTALTLIQRAIADMHLCRAWGQILCLHAYNDVKRASIVPRVNESFMLCANTER